MHKATILIVEDDAILAMNLQSIVSLSGYTVVGPLASGEDAVAFLAKNSVNLVLMDIELAGTMNGITTAETINQNLDIPIVFLTGFSNETLFEQAKIVAPYGYLIKPVLERELIATITMSLHRHDLDRKLKESHIALEKSEAKYRLLMEATLKDSEKHYRELVQNVNSAILRWKHDGTITFMNSYAQSFFGYCEEEVVGRHVNILLPKKDSSWTELSDLIQDVVAHPERYQNNETENACQDGRKVWMTWAYKQILDSNGQLIEILAVGNDITESKRAEAALRESEERFRLLFENHSAVKLVLEVETGNIVDANKAAALYYGWSKNELKHMSISQINTLPVDIVNSEMEKAIACKKTRFEFCHRLADGSIREVEVFSNNIEIEGKSFLYSIVHDINDRKKAEKALRESEARRREQKVLRISEARFREVLEHSLDASYKRNLQTGCFDYLSPVFSNISGYTLDEIVLLHTEIVKGLIHFDDLPEVERMLALSISDFSQKFHHLEYRFKHKDGQYRWFHNRFTVMRNEEGYPLARIGSISDITDRKLVEEKKLQIMKEQQAILDTANVGISMMVDRKQLWVNRKTVELFQYSKEEMEGQSTQKLYPSQEKYEKLGREAYPALALGLLYETEQKLIRRDGSPILVKYNGRAIEPNDMSRGVIWILEDITERRRNEEALREVYSELEQRVYDRTSDLEKTNATLTMMLDYARKTETDIQERVVSNLRTNLLGIIDVLKKQQLAKITRDLVELLETTTLHLAHPIARNLESQLLKLTAREIQLANFIRLGKSTKELVELLNISKKTVESHRDNLRKKLGIHNKKINLRTFLNSEFAQ